jgi:hypothetical protein
VYRDLPAEHEEGHGEIEIRLAALRFEIQIWRSLNDLVFVASSAMNKSIQSLDYRLDGQGWPTAQDWNLGRGKRVSQIGCDAQIATYWSGPHLHLMPELLN